MVKAYANVLEVCYLLEDKESIKLLEDRISQYRAPNSTIRINIQLVVLHSELLQCITQSEYTPIPLLEKRFLALEKKHPTPGAFPWNLPLHYNLFYGYFMKCDWERAFIWLKKCEQLLEKVERRELQNALRVVEPLLAYEESI